MGQQIVVDTDYLLDSIKSIKVTSSEISKSIITLQKLSNELTSFVNDESMKNFNISFSNYTLSLGSVPDILDVMLNYINILAKNYDEIDNSEASELKQFVSADDTQL